MRRGSILDYVRSIFKYAERRWRGGQGGNAEPPPLGGALLPEPRLRCGESSTDFVRSLNVSNATGRRAGESAANRNRFRSYKDRPLTPPPVGHPSFPLALRPPGGRIM